jgi:hypothetical protein
VCDDLHLRVGGDLGLDYDVVGQQHPGARVELAAQRGDRLAA